MKRVFTSPDIAEVGLYRTMLGKAGIRCVEFNEQMAHVLPSAPFQAELWVLNDADYPTAAALVKAWQAPAQTAETGWTCPRCGEKLESQFGKCWKCGTSRVAYA